MSAQNVFFPEEILLEIFSYVEAKYVLRCACVCKLWYAVSRSKELVEKHVIRSGPRYYDMHTIGKSRDSDGHVEYITHISHLCRGLVLLGFSTKLSSVNLRIYNPTTNFSMDLPPPHKRVRSIYMFLNTCSGSYNVLSLYLDEEKKTRHLELLDLGGQSYDPCPNTDLSWRTLNISEFENVSEHDRYYSAGCMPTEGTTLYIINTVPSSTKLKLTCVDIVELTCTTLDVSLNLCVNRIRTSFQLYGGKPSVISLLEDKITISALEDYTTRKWADTIVLPLSYLDEKRISLPQMYADDMQDDKEHLSPRCSDKAPATLVSLKGMQPQRKEPRIKLDTTSR